MTVLITGASRGIGRALHDLHRERGVAVIGTARSPEEGMMRLDVADPASHAALAEALGGRPLDVLVCNAGVNLDKGRGIAEITARDFTESFAVNATGAFLAVQALLPNLRAGTRPRVAIVSSQMGSSEIASGGGLAYRASKAAAINIGRNLASDLAPEEIAVGIYHPDGCAPTWAAPAPPSAPASRPRAWRRASTRSASRPPAPSRPGTGGRTPSDPGARPPAAALPRPGRLPPAAALPYEAGACRSW